MLLWQGLQAPVSILGWWAQMPWRQHSAKVREPAQSPPLPRPCPLSSYGEGVTNLRATICGVTAIGQAVENSLEARE